jgi:hypothetical protein
MLDVPRELAQYLSRLLHIERRRRGTRKNSRALTCFRQAVLGLRWFRQNVEVTALARDHGSPARLGTGTSTRSSRCSPTRRPICTKLCRRPRPTGCLTWMADAGVKFHDLQQIAGHGTITTTQRYLHSSLESVTAAGDALQAHLLGPGQTWSPSGPQLKVVRGSR